MDEAWMKLERNIAGKSGPNDMKIALTSRAAVAALAAGSVAASGDEKDAGPAPGEGGTDKPANPPAKPDEKPADPPAQPEAEQAVVAAADAQALIADADGKGRSEEHTCELQSLMGISYGVFCLKKQKH